MQEDERVEPMQTGPEAEAVPARAPGRSLLRTALSWVRDLTFSVLIAVVLIVFIYQPVKVEGTSMEPSLTDQERIFINKFTYEFGLGQIERGDTIVFWYPFDRSKSYIKRVIGLPGDRIRIDSGQVYVNDRPLLEDYVPKDYRDTLSWPADARGVDREVPAGNYFVLGDHRSQSSDSRAWGYVPRDLIYGKAVFVYWPLDKMGRLH
jgi:signal peptidase I